MKSNSKAFIRVYIRQFLWYSLTQLMHGFEVNDLRRSAVVFSPHPDDEVLGCGGTIIKKKRVGADLKVVFMTNGNGSHPDLISKDDLKSIRATEALASAEILGMEQDDVIFFEFEDGKLIDHQDAAVQKVGEIVRSYQPNQIFIPHFAEMPSDHSATNKIVLSALQKYGGDATIYEYPLWLWYHWPWVSSSNEINREILTVLKNIFVANLVLLRDFRCFVDINDVLAIKQKALEEYKSQMSRLIPDPRWLTLHDVSNGEFLQCFFQQYEILCQYSFSQTRLRR